MTKPKVAVIGAGISGLLIASQLSTDFDITVYDKSRGIGGRMSTRRDNDNLFSFDHGFQGFSITNPDFEEFVTDLINNNIVATWNGDFIKLDANLNTQVYDKSKRYTFIERANSLCKYLARDVKVQLNTEIAPNIIRLGNQWILNDKDNNLLGKFDWIICTAPLLQTLKILSNYLDPDLYWDNAMQARFMLMLGFKDRLKLDFSQLLISNHDVVELITNNSSKPMRNQNTASLVIQSTHSFATMHLEDDLDAVNQQVYAETLSLLPQLAHLNPDYRSLHRWRYAFSNQALISPIINQEKQFIAIGDWCSGSNLQDIWLLNKQFISLFSDVI